VLALTLLAVASHTSAQAPGSPPLELTKQYLAAAKARDAAKVASFYAEDAVLMPPNAPPIKGRKAIQQDHERLFKVAGRARSERRTPRCPSTTLSD
jgi:ketosteroid isomerase-like protein